MLLDEMGIIGHQVKIADNAPMHAGQVGKIVTMTSDRLYVQFADGKKEWISNKHVVGTRKTPVAEYAEFDLYPLTEMAAKKQCELCGKTMAANHYWYKGGWKCKKSADADKQSTKEDKDPFPEMDDETYNKLSKAQQAAQDAKEKAWYVRHGRTGPQDYKPKDANEEAAYKRAVALRADLAAKAKKK